MDPAGHQKNRRQGRRNPYAWDPTIPTHRGSQYPNPPPRYRGGAPSSTTLQSIPRSRQNNSTQRQRGPQIQPLIRGIPQHTRIAYTLLYVQWYTIHLVPTLHFTHSIGNPSLYSIYFQPLHHHNTLLWELIQDNISLSNRHFYAQNLTTNTAPHKLTNILGKPIHLPLHIKTSRPPQVYTAEHNSYSTHTYTLFHPHSHNRDINLLVARKRAHIYKKDPP
jgi:hypothetical protein